MQKRKRLKEARRLAHSSCAPSGGSQPACAGSIGCGKREVWKSDLEGQQPHAQPGPTSLLRPVPSAGRTDTCDVFHFTSFPVSFLSGGRGKLTFRVVPLVTVPPTFPVKRCPAAAPVSLTVTLRFVRNTHMVIQMTGNRYLISLPGEPATTGGLELPVPSTPPLERGEGLGGWISR